MSDLYERLSIDSSVQWLYLDKNDDIDIPLLPDDHIVIHGGERIFSDDINPQIGENPHVRNLVCPEFNGKKLEPGLDQCRISSDDLCNKDAELASAKLFADLQGQVDAFIPSGIALVIQESDSYITIPDSGDEAVDLEACSKAGRKPPKGAGSYKIKIEGEKYTVTESSLTGQAILALASKTYEQYTLNQKLHEGRRKTIESEEEVDFSQPGIERFEVVRRQAQQG